jgi:hypothetical protein
MSIIAKKEDKFHNPGLVGLLGGKSLFNQPADSEVDLVGLSNGGIILRKEYLTIAVRSAINPTEYNYLLNPMLPSFREFVIVENIVPLGIDVRLLR